ncbi:hypothetical protein RCH14_004557 [Massilia sp. MP_M2]|uniref:hypothetical protein n=1 Tax=Massilia sp. MP_M2 TaxID=3071713 RepID=UPI00319E5E3E
MQQSVMHVRQWDDREVAEFNALHSADPFIKQLVNGFPLKVARFYVLRWTSANNVQRTAVHFCEAEAKWRAAVFGETGTQASVEARYGSPGDTYVLVDGRQRAGCSCHNCSHAVGDLKAIEKPKRISAARARKLARAAYYNNRL